ncbi:putative protein kinase RLK-Pelle-LRR-IX family [Helianthus annuus]|uniref:Protein kinase domain-containing protein n=1 Tax=Helianthus annuus TaxID=4232 RepID=A0A9K3H573_HELAN|nr:putative protein kinase RLK-Pelle-LRR-IX family [Helianthus annuus]KAJ0484774.1 putative protein kinase RLK-Pelle-LRR-IX family [Helianthus annuus]KAJ0655328.1 putative protein kinase RLK-Pelle-LRR-IX family [Helianthus annuus]KAJ0659022.1 putative protein kinase RLK-Pelle-LRR-IX family [Helianthus annuus]KAJ0839277.1 putative protein kinase RLK-Pelle-LRR-IX family [Helianthus annuus]
MESGVICNKALDEFESEISVLTKRYGISSLLAHESFIHRDLKSSNILLCDDFQAKVSDFGPVKLVPDGGKSIMTHVAWTFGYVAPKYASNKLFSLYIYIYMYVYMYVYLYILWMLQKGMLETINFWHGSSKKL